MESCAVCMSEFTSKIRKPVHCRFCDYKMCADCTKSYLLTVANEPKCMSCEKGFTNDHLLTMTTKSFLKNEFRKARIQNLLERERSLLPATFARYEVEVAQEKLNKRKLKVEQRVYEMRRSLGSLEKLEDLLVGFYDEVHELRLEQKALRARHRTSDDPIVDDRVMHCPKADCVGFLSSAFQCMVCSTEVCKRCHAIKAPGSHTCKESDIATVKTLKSDSKSCPKCKVLIFKTEGCNQMFCTHCKAVFDWTTLRILNGPVHNPHYFEYLASLHRPTEVPDAIDACGATTEQVMTRIGEINYRLWRADLEAVNKLARLGRASLEALEEFPTGGVYNEDTYVELRKERLFGGLSEADWFKRLSSRETTRERVSAYVAVHQMFAMASRDILRRLNPILHSYQVCRSTTEEMIAKAHELVDEATVLRQYYNREMRKLWNNFKTSSRKFVDADFRWYTIGKEAKTEAGLLLELFGGADDDDT